MLSVAERASSAERDDSSACRQPIVVATDGRPECAGAIELARRLADRLDASLEVIAVYQPPAPLVPDPRLVFADGQLARARSELTQRVRSQCAFLEGARDLQTPHVNVREGDAATVIARFADAHDAQLVVLGLGRHEVVDRIFGDETALKVARKVRAPLLAVPAEAPASLQSAIVGIDFSDASLRAAQVALGLVQQGGVLRIVYVVPKTRTILDAVIPEEEEERYLRHRFMRFVARLTVPAGVTIEEVRLDGEPARELLRYAAEMHAGFIAVGSHGAGFVERLILGSMTTKVLRGAQCPVLVVPPEAAVEPNRHESAHGFTMRFDETRWSDVLDDFTRSNAGRRTRLEVDDPEIGAQRQEEEYRLLGIDYDPHDRRIDIMLGELGGGEPHLSRRIGGVESLHILSDIDGRDLALRLRHGDAQTILTLVR